MPATPWVSQRPPAGSAGVSSATVTGSATAASLPEHGIRR
jgi:hypothetical protein